MRRGICAVVVAVLAVVLPGRAGADTLLSPFFGVTFGGDAPVKAPTVGGSATFFGNSAGLEIELGYTPHFFGEAFDSGNVTTLTGSFVVGGNPDGKGVAPYGLVGAGLVRTGVALSGLVQDVHYNNFGIGIGAGVNALFTDHVGVRGDLRYYRRLQSPSANGIIPIADTFDYWRATIGLAVYYW